MPRNRVRVGDVRNHCMWVTGAVFALMCVCGKQVSTERIGSDGRDYRAAIAEAGTCTVQEGTPGGGVTLPIESEPLTFNPLAAADRVSIEVAALMFEGLTRIDGRSGEPAPAAAESWEVSADGREVTFRLRPGMVWSDGTALTAADVVFTLDTLLRDSAAVRSGAAALLRVCADTLRVAALDSLTVRVTLPRPCALLLRGLSVPLMPAHIVRPRLRRLPLVRLYGLMTRPDSLVVNGPFRLGVYVPTQRVVLHRNPRYWRKSSGGHPLPYLDSVVLNVTPDENLRKVRFQQGQLDCYVARGSDYPLLAQDSGAHYRVVCLGPSRTATAIVFNMVSGGSTDSISSANPGIGWLRDRRVRMAVAHALDIGALLRAAGLTGFAQPSAVCLADTLLMAPDVPRYRFDTTRARALLSEAGFADRNGDGVVEDVRGNELRFAVLTAGENLPRVKTAEALCAALARVGVAARLEVAPYDTVVRRLGSGTSCWEAAVVGIALPQEPLEAWELWHSSGTYHLWNPRQSSPPEPWEKRTDSLFEVALRTGELPARIPLYHEWQRILAAEIPVIFLYVPERIIGISSSLANACVSPVFGVFADLAQVFVREPPRARVTAALMGNGSTETQSPVNGAESAGTRSQ